MKAIARRIAIILILFAAALYGWDYAAVRYRIPKSSAPFGTVQIDRYYAIKLKDGKIEYDYAGSETEACVNSLFPHFGRRPCWYVARNRRKLINI